jgi:hypothetical protein
MHARDVAVPVSKKAITTISDHDMDQLMLLAAVRKIRLPELLRRIIRAYLDGSDRVYEGDVSWERLRGEKDAR